MQGMSKNTYYYNIYLELQTVGFIIRNTLYCTYVGRFHLSQAAKALREGRGIALLNF